MSGSLNVLSLNSNASINDIKSSINGSASNLQDGSGRSYSPSFSGQSGAPSPAFHHVGNIPGLHNIHGSFNVPNMSGTFTSRNSSVNSVPSGGVQQPNGSLSGGRFVSNNLPVALSQLSHGSSHGHSGITNRGGFGVPQILGNTGSRITTSMGNMVSGGNLGRNIGSGGGLSIPGLGSRMSLTPNNGSGINVQGQNRLLSGVLPQGSSQVMTMLGNSYPNVGGPFSQNHVQTANSLMLNDHSTDSSLFDIKNDFPQLMSRPGSAGGPQGEMGSLRKQGLGPIVQQNQEFSIQNEDFPALPGYKGNNANFSMDLHQKEQLHDNAMSMMQPQHFTMGRSAGFNLGGAYPSYRSQQQHSSSTGGPPGIGLRQLNSPSAVSGIGYDQLFQQYQHQNQSQFNSQQTSFRDPEMKTTTEQSEPDSYGLMGLTKLMKTTGTSDYNSLARGFDLTTLGLSLNSSETLHKTFKSPWTNEPAKSDPEFSVPQCYFAVQPPALRQACFSKFTAGTLFYIFYSMPKDEAQLYAANELHNRGWFYHKEHRVWLIRNGEPMVKSNGYERAAYQCFDPNKFDVVLKENFVLHYDLLENRPILPQH